MFHNFSHENRAVDEIVWKHVVEPEDTDDNKIRLMIFECWITKTKKTGSEYILFIALPRRLGCTKAS